MQLLKFWSVADWKVVQKKSDNLHHSDVARFKNFQKEILNNLKTLLSIHEKLRKKNVNSDMSVNYLNNIK